jgi:hypothetical protein
VADLQISPEITAKQRYEKLQTDRQPFLVRGRECAALTIPAVLPPQGFGASSQLPTPYQSLGARGARTLASKLLLSLFPSIPFFNWKIDSQSLEKLGAQRGEIEKALSAREKATTTELDLCVFRPAAFTGLLHLIITGNACIYVPPKQEERAQTYRLDQYVVRRDAAGNLLEAVILETVDLASLPPDVREVVAKSDEKYKDRDPKSLDAAPVELYTHIFWGEKSQMWETYQEAGGTRIPGTEGKFKKDELPWLFLRFSTQPGESYGRGYVEEYLGDLDSLEALSETLVEGSAASAKIIFMVKPGGVTNIKVVATAKNGDVISGDANDVQAMQVQKQSDLSVAKSQAEEIANRLSYAFLLHSAIQRNGERVTAEEIRFMASELDDGLGGVYTLMAADFQLPAVRLFERRMEKRLGVQKLPGEMVHPVIVAGLEAIGRGHDQRNLQLFVTEIVQILGPEMAMRYLKPLEFMKRSAAAYGIDTEGLMPSEEEVQQQEQQAMMQAMIQHLGPQGIQQMGGVAQTALKGAMEGSVPQIPPQ